MKQLLLLNPEQVSEEEAERFPIREAARAIVIDGRGMIALLHVAKDEYYKLPGGGLEGAEDKKTALERECREEIGCDIKVTGEVGSIIEYRKTLHLKQISYCYLAKVKGEKGKPHFTDNEIKRGFKLVWLPFKDVVYVIQGGLAKNLEGSAFIVPRDIAFLKAAENLIGTLSIDAQQH